MHKNRILYCIYLVIIFYVSMIYNNYGLYVVLAASFLLPVAALLYSLLLWHKVHVSWGMPEYDPQKNEPARVGLLIRNNSFLPTGDILVRFSVTDVQKNQSKKRKTKTAVAGHSTGSSAVSAEFNHPGNVSCRILRVRVCEPLGLFCVTGNITVSEVSFTIMPMVADIAVTPFRHNPYAYIEEEEYSKVKPGDDPSELFGTREYRPGDRRNRIHWALTAKQDELIVKELGLPEECASLVLFDMVKTDDDDEIATLFETVFSLSAHLAAQSHRHRFAWFNENSGVICRQTVETRDDVFTVIPQVFSCPLAGRDRSVVPLYFAEHPRERFRNIFYVTNAGDRLGLDALHAAREDAYVDCYVISKNGTGRDEGEWRENIVRPMYLAEDFSEKGGAQ